MFLTNVSRGSFLALAATFAAGSLLGFDVDKVPPDNWAVARSRAGVRTTMTDATQPRAFIGLTPCRIVDTRGNGAPITGGPFIANQVRTWQLVNKCGLPAGADAVSLNLTVTGTGAHAFGFATLWPAGAAQPTASSINWSSAGQTIANAAIVPLGTSGSVSVISGNAGTDMVLDINGYFSQVLGTPDNYFQLNNNSESYTAYFTNSSTTCGGLCGIYMNTARGTAIAGRSDTQGDGVFGTSTDGSGAGVHGAVSAGSSPGVLGEQLALDDFGSGIIGVHSSGGRGVVGRALGTTGGSARGVLGFVASTSSGAAGVDGVATAFSGATYGVRGLTLSAETNAAGVLGHDGTAVVGGAITLSAGLRGESRDNIGVLGISEGIAVGGGLYDSIGSLLASGYLGIRFATAADATPGPWAVFAIGNLGASGAKHFVEPHPTDATKTITYSSLEGPEVGTYFRGTATVVNHRAVIRVPEHFRTVTDEVGLTVQLTAVGAAATMYIESQDLNSIVINSSKDISVHYLVQGVRRAFREFQPVNTGYEFMPASPDAKMPASLTEEAKRRLVSNGTYNADGTVNMATAEKAGFAKVWSDREAEAKVRAARPAEKPLQ